MADPRTHTVTQSSFNGWAELIQEVGATFDFSHIDITISENGGRICFTLTGYELEGNGFEVTVNTALRYGHTVDVSALQHLKYWLLSMPAQSRVGIIPLTTTVGIIVPGGPESW